MATWIRLVAILLIVSIGWGGAYLSGATQLVDTQLIDARFQVGQRPASGQIVLVDIDAKSLTEVGVWPWPRQLHADLLNAAALAGATRIAFDVDFSSRSRAEDDAEFAEALGTSGLETFLAAFVQVDPASTKLVPSMPIEPLLAASWPVSINVPVDPDGRVRRFPLSLNLNGENVGSMPAVLSGHPDAEGEFQIDHAIDAASIPHVSYVDLLHGRIEQGALTGKTLIVGATAIELHDLFPIPRAGIVSGSTVIALATETLMQDRALGSWQPPLVTVVLLLGTGCWLVLRRSLRTCLVASVGAVVAIEAVAVWFYLERAVMLETAELQLAVITIALLSLLREFDLRQFRLWVARAETRNTTRLLERVVDDGFDAVVIVDTHGRISRINEAACVLLDLSRTDPPVALADLPGTLVHVIKASMAELSDVTVPRPPERSITKLAKGENARIVEYTVAPFWLEGKRNRGEAQRVGYVSLMLHDVTDRERSQDRLRYAALHDSLTGLPNRRALEAELDNLVASNLSIALLAFDLDRFKGVNDALGHATGDAVLVETARRVAHILPNGASVFRIGGDEFVMLLPSANADFVRSIANGIVREINAPYSVNGHRVSVGTCVGIAADADGCRDPAVLRRRADVALYKAKRTQAGQVVKFDRSMDEARLERLTLERDLVHAVETGAFELVYQPQARLRDNIWTGAEALIRWRHPERGYVSPVVFIPIAEETGLIHKLGAWVMQMACRDAQHWPEGIKVAVNVSPLQFLAGDIVGAVKSALATSGLDPKRLELEITESSFVGENHRLSAIFDEILALGVTFALDDFGTGYSSLGYLHRFPISKIKIDRSFVTDIPDSRHSMAVLRSVIVLASGLGIRTIAEGVETASQAGILREIGCGEVQGYLYSKPLDIAQSTELFKEGSRMRRFAHEEKGDLLRAVG